MRFFTTSFITLLSITCSAQLNHLLDEKVTVQVLNEYDDLSDAFNLESSSYNSNNTFNSSIQGAIRTKYIGIGVSTVVVYFLNNNDTYEIGLFLGITGSVMAGVSAIIQDFKTASMSRALQKLSEDTKKHQQKNIHQQDSPPPPLKKIIGINNDDCDGKIHIDSRNFSCFHVISQMDTNPKDPTVLIQYYHNGELKKTWMKASSDELVWEE